MTTVGVYDSYLITILVLVLVLLPVNILYSCTVDLLYRYVYYCAALVDLPRVCSFM